MRICAKRPAGSKTRRILPTNIKPRSTIEYCTALRLGPAADAILAAALDLGADLIVIGTPGKNSVREFLSGVSAQVLRHAQCPVLQVR